MSQEELGKTEETLEETSSAELSQSETAEVVESNDETTAESGTTAEETTSTEERPVSEVEANHDAESTDTSGGDDAPATDTSEDDDEIDHKFKKHEVYKGTITKTAPTAVYVDLGDGTEGIVPGRELEQMARKMLESLVEGAEVDVFVVNPKDHKGEIVLSINHALEELDWRKAEEFGKSKDVYDALIGGYNKGGLIVRFGRLRGFVPQSQLAEERVRTMKGDTPEERYGPMVNQEIGVKVMEVDRSRNRLILSERAAMREVRQRRKESLIEELNVGEIRKGIVVSLENFGAFVDIGGAEGLVHLTELAWGHVTHPRQAVDVGEEIDVEIISIDPKAKRIGLSRRKLVGDPWDEIATSMRRGQLVRAQITKLTKFGAFAKLVDNQAVEGLIHISELSDERVTHPKEVVKRGDTVALRIVKIDVKNRRLGLSLKSVNSTEYLDLDWEMAIQDSANLPEDEPVVSEEPAVEETPAEEPVAEVEAPVEDAPVEEPVAEVETPAEESAIDEAPAEESPEEEADSDD
jgi:small subunit ribosomal protein S1